MLTILTRDRSGLLEPQPGAARLEMSALIGIAVHHSGGSGDATAAVANPNGYIQLLQKFFMVDRGYSDIAYNYLVLANGVVMEGRGLRLRSAANGGETTNAKYLSVLFPGDFRSGGSSLTAAQIASFRSLRQFILGVIPNAREVVPHSAIRATECPGGNIQAAIAQLAQAVPPGGLPFPRQVLRKGSQGAAVRCLQQTLNIWRPGILRVDGDFGSVTDGVVRQFQTVHGIVVDGVVGTQTWRVVERYGGCSLSA